VILDRVEDAIELFECSTDEDIVERGSEVCCEVSRNNEATSMEIEPRLIVREAVAAAIVVEIQKMWCTTLSRIHNRCAIVDGQRVVDEQNQERLATLAPQIALCRRQSKAIEEEWGKQLRKLRRYEKEWLRLQGKDFVYQIDVELDQFITFFRISLVSISCWFLKQCKGNSRMSLARLLHTILLLPAEIELTKELRRVKLRCNPKDPKRMNQLRPALELLNQLAIQDMDQRRFEFALV
jgi:hypothetical protein